MLFLLSLLASAIAVSDERPTLPATFGDFTISRLPSVRSTGGRLVERPPELEITSNVASLKIANSPSLSSSYIQAMRQEGMTAVARAARAQSGTTPLISVEGGNVFLAKSTFGGEDFQVVIDTGSSDPWLAATNFICYDPDDDSEQTQDYCGFGPDYDSTQSSTYSLIANENFNISYADGEYLTGAMGYETVTMAGVQVTNQKFATVDRAAWFGDGQSSGLVGFAYRTLTSAHVGATGNGASVLYDPLFVNMYTNAGVASIFSIAIDRDVNVGGTLALGGIPDIQHSPYFASTPIIPVGVNSTNQALVYQYYTIDIDGFAYSSDSSTQFNVGSSVNPLKTSLVGNNTHVIVDSGTSLVYAPNTVASGVAAAFSPPGTYDASVASWYVDCNAKPPVFGVSISQKIFYVNALDMVIALGDGTCVSGVQPALGGLDILGDVFMKNVLSVFDIGAEEMRFAARQFSPL